MHGLCPKDPVLSTGAFYAEALPLMSNGPACPVLPHDHDSRMPRRANAIGAVPSSDSSRLQSSHRGRSRITGVLCGSLLLAGCGARSALLDGESSAETAGAA